MTQEDITLTQVRKIVDLIRWETERHTHHCTLCIPGSWQCPDAHLLVESKLYWQKREENILRVKEILEP